MARCNDCAKFVSYDTEVEPEESDSPEIEGGEFKVTVTRSLTCGECGTEMKTAELELVQAVEYPEKCGELDTTDGEHSHDWDFDLSYSPAMRREGKGRGVKTFYGADASGKAVCTECKHEIDIQCSDEVQASSMEECQ